MAFVQEKDAILTGGGAISTGSLAFDSPNTAGNMIFVVVGWFTVVGAYRVKIHDSNGNQYLPVPYIITDTTSTSGIIPGGEFIRAYYALNVKGGANTVTVDFFDSVSDGSTTANFAGLGISEYSGVNSFLNVDSGQVGFSSGTSTTPASWTSASASGLAIGYAVAGNYVDWTAGAGWTLRSTPTATQLAIQDRTLSGATTSSTFTMGTNTGWGTGIAMFYQATDPAAVMVQSVDHNDGMLSQSPTDVVSFNRPNLAGDFLFLNYVWVNTPLITITNVTDTAGNTWVSTPRQDLGGLGTTSQAWYVLGCNAASSNTVTVHFSDGGASFIGMEMQEWSGIDTIDQLSVTIGSSATPTSPTVTTTKDHELILGFYTTQAGFQAMNIAYPYVLGATQVRSVNNGSLVDQPIGAYTADFTQNISNVWSAGIITLYKAPPAPTVYSVPDSRNYGNFPNDSRDVQGTLTYDVPSIDSRAEGAPESCLRWWFDTSFNRTLSLPEDSRVAPNIPENSRTEPPF